MPPSTAHFPVVLALGFACVATPFADGAHAAEIAGETGVGKPWTGERNAAVQAARRGDPLAALPVLERLHRAHPEDIDVTHDLIAVSVWAGRDRAAIQLFAGLAQGVKPDYVIETAALAYRHLGRPFEALVLYRQRLLESPDHALFRAGEIRSLTDLDQIDAAVALADEDLKASGARRDVLLAAGYAASAQKKPVEALRYIDSAVALNSTDREAIHDRIVAINDMGAPQVAQQLADDNTGVLTMAERRRIDGDAAAALVRWGVFEPTNEATRFAASDRAIAALDILIAHWSQDGAAAANDVLRARFDRMIALRDRVRMADVLTEYDDLTRHGVAVPGYVLVAAADAYLYFRQPETARDLYVRALMDDPRHPETRLALFYAYIDLDDFDAAYRHIDSAAADLAIWRYLTGLNDPIENPDRATADLASAVARLYGDELADAHQRVAVMAEAAPNNTLYLTALANVYSARGWPRLAAEEYEISRALKPVNLTTEVGQARNNLMLREYRTVEARLADLMRRFPENREVQRLDRIWQVHNMAEASLSVEKAVRASTSVSGGSGIAVGAQLYSPPIDYNWRIFGAEYAAHERASRNQGEITLRRTAIGAEYRGRDFTGSVEGTIAANGAELGTTLTDSIDNGHGGARALASWELDDYWQIDASAEIVSRDTPLRALNRGITADAVSSDVTFRESESREIRLGGEVMDFTDGNLRTSLSGQFVQRVATLPRFSVDGIVGLAGSRNSGDGNRPYYNPGEDALATLGVSVRQTIYRRYEFDYEHHLVVAPGVYWQQGFGDGGAVNVLYEHQMRANDVFDAGLGVNFARQPFDGNYESNVAILLNLRWRFGQ